MVDYIINFTDLEKDSFILKPYTSDGFKFPTVGVLEDSAISVHSSLVIYGRGHPNYGERTDENLFHLLENFSGGSNPLQPNPGQLWHSRRTYWRNSTGVTWWKWSDTLLTWGDVTSSISELGALPVSPVDGETVFLTSGSPVTGVLMQFNAEFGVWVSRLNKDAIIDPGVELPEDVVRVYDGMNTWRFLNSGIAQSTEPQDANAGALWFDTTNGTLNIYNGTTWGTTNVDFLNDLNDVNTANLPAPIVNDLFQFDGSNWGQTRLDPIILNKGMDLTAAGKKILTAETLSGDVDQTVTTKKYVDDEIALVSAGATADDIYIENGDFFFSTIGSPDVLGSGTGELVLKYRAIGSPPISLPDLIIPGFIVNANELPFDNYFGTPPALPGPTVEDALRHLEDNKLERGGDIMTGILNMSANIVMDGVSDILNLPLATSQSLNPSSAVSKDYVDSEILAAATGATQLNERIIATSGIGSPLMAQDSFVTPLFINGFNKLAVTVNGVKAYSNTPAQQTVFFNPSKVSTDLITTMQPHTVTVTGPSEFTVFGIDVSTLYASPDIILGRDITGSPIVDTQYTIVSAVFGGLNTVITVLEVIVGTPTQIGRIFNATVDVNAAGPLPISIDSFSILTFGQLVVDLTAQMHSIPFIPNFASVGMFGGNMVFTPDNGGTGSISVVDGITPTTALFANLDDFLLIGLSILGTTYGSYGYNETGSLGGNAAGIIFNTPIPVGSIVEAINYL